MDYASRRSREHLKVGQGCIMEQYMAAEDQQHNSVLSKMHKMCEELAKSTEERHMFHTVLEQLLEKLD